MPYITAYILIVLTIVAVAVLPIPGGRRHKGNRATDAQPYAQNDDETTTVTRRALEQVG